MLLDLAHKFLQEEEKTRKKNITEIHIETSMHSKGENASICIQKNHGR